MECHVFLRYTIWEHVTPNWKWIAKRDGFMLKETTGAFDGAQTHDWQASTDNESDELPTKPPLP